MRGCFTFFFSFAIMSTYRKGNIMPTTKASQKAVNKYKDANYKRIPLDVRKEQAEAIKEAADTLGMSVNGFIKEAISYYMLSMKSELQKLNDLNYEMTED